MNKTKFLSVFITLVFLFSMYPKAVQAHENPDTPHPTPKTPPLSKKAQKSAKIIDDINDRQVLVPPGGKQLYRIKGTDIYVEVSGIELRDPYLATSSLAGPVTYTQVCGLNIYQGGMLWAELRNRANVTYYTGYTLAPARINWMDMRGTRTTLVLAKWKGLGQYSYPSLMQRFEKYGYTQAYGNLEICFYPFGCLTNYYSSRVLITSSRTYCR